MSSLDKVDDIFYLIKKYILPTAFLAGGIYLLYVALVPSQLLLNNGSTLDVKQDDMFLYAALIMIVVSVIWFLYLFDMIKSMVGYIIMVVMLIGSVAVLYIDYVTVQKEVEFNNRYAERDIEIKTRIMDLKAAEVAYKEVKGFYTDSFDDLQAFVKSGTKMDIVKIGALPDRKITPEERDLIYKDNRVIDFNMNEKEAAFLARMANPPADLVGFKRDTVYKPVLDVIFKSERYVEARSKIGGVLPFNADSMIYVPFSSNLAKLDTASMFKGEIKVPTLRITMTHPMQDPIKGYVDYTIGAIDDNHLRDNWSK